MANLFERGINFESFVPSVVRKKWRNGDMAVRRSSGIPFTEKTTDSRMPLEIILGPSTNSGPKKMKRKTRLEKLEAHNHKLRTNK